MNESRKTDDWLQRFRAELARLLEGRFAEAFKADSMTLDLLEDEQRQLSLCWKTGHGPPLKRSGDGGAG